MPGWAAGACVAAEEVLAPAINSGQLNLFSHVPCGNPQPQAELIPLTFLFFLPFTIRKVLPPRSKVSLRGGDLWGYQWLSGCHDS